MNLKKFQSGKVALQEHDNFPELVRQNKTSARLLVAWLYMVWEAGGWAETTRRYNVSTCGMYYRLWNLEQRLGKQVFVRQKRPFTLTEAGENLIRRYVGYDNVGH